MSTPLLRRIVPALLLVALLAVAPAFAAAAPAGDAPAQVARRGRRRAARRRASGAVPRPFNPLWSADRSLRVIVLMQQVHGQRPRQIVQVTRGSVPIACPTSGELRILVAVQVPLRGSSFSGTETESSGARKWVSGRFTSATRAVGEYQVVLPDPRGGGSCDTGRVAFTATR